MIELSKKELEDMQIKSAEEGARLALAKIGLEDEQALHDIRDLRSILAAYREARKVVWQTCVKYITMFILGALSYGIAASILGGK